MKIYLPLLLVAGMSSYTSAQLVQISNDAAWPTAAVIDTGAPGTSFTLSDTSSSIIDYDGERDVKDQRTLLQTFSVSGAGYLVTDLYFGYSGGSGTSDDVQIRIFEVDDVHGDGSTADDDQINGFPTGTDGDLNTNEIFNQSITFTSLVTTVGDFNVMHVSIPGGFLLPGIPGSGGYGISLFNPDNDGVFPFRWAIERSDTGTGVNLGPYLGGRSYSDNGGSAQETYDWALAMEGEAIPEPSTYALLAGVATLGLAIWRRRRK